MPSDGYNSNIVLHRILLAVAAAAIVLIVATALLVWRVLFLGARVNTMVKKVPQFSALPCAHLRSCLE